jgi:hypothetical protein
MFSKTRGINSHRQQNASRTGLETGTGRSPAIENKKVSNKNRAEKLRSYSRLRSLYSCLFAGAFGR